jgi:hypothetical protein
VPALSKKIFRRNFPKLLSTGGGGGGRSDYEKFLLDSIFPTKLTEFPTKFVPFIFIISQYCPTVKRILPDWLCLPNKLGGLPPPPLPRPVRPCFHCMVISLYFQNNPAQNPASFDLYYAAVHRSWSSIFISILIFIVYCGRHFRSIDHPTVLETTSYPGSFHYAPR